MVDTLLDVPRGVFRWLALQAVEATPMALRMNPTETVKLTGELCPRCKNAPLIQGCGFVGCVDCRCVFAASLYWRAIATAATLAYQWRIGEGKSHTVALLLLDHDIKKMLARVMARALKPTYPTDPHSRIPIWTEDDCAPD